MTTSVNQLLITTGRLLLALMFLISGLAKLASTHVFTSGYVGSDGLPLDTIPAIAWGSVEALAALLLALGFRVPVMALVLAMLVLLTNLVFHRFWAFEPEFQFAQQVLFGKNLALLGGLIALAGYAHARTQSRVDAPHRL